MAILYKIIDKQSWDQACHKGLFSGAAIDLRDGYIHLSTATQVRETARLHFAGVTDLLLVAIDESQVSANLKWEASRGGQLFPHVYGEIATALAMWAKPLPWNDVEHEFPVELS